MVGTPGSSGDGGALVKAMGLTAPDRICGRISARLPNIMSTRPAMISAIAGGPPRNGTCSILISAIEVKSAAQSW